MKVGELIKQLKQCDQNSQMVFYYNKDHVLNNCELAYENNCWPHEPILEFDDHVELIIKPEGSEEGGVEEK